MSLRRNAALASLLSIAGCDPGAAAPDDTGGADVRGMSMLRDGGGMPGTAHYFPGGAFFNQDATGMPVHADSDAMLADLEAAGGWGLGRMQIDFSIDVLTVGEDVARMSFEPTGDFYEPDCDPAGIPIPEGGNIEGEDGYECTSDGDCHLIVWVPSAMRLYEMWRANITGGTFYGGCLAVWDTTRVYPAEGRGDQCTSADAAGFPIAPLLFTADEVFDGEIAHAIRFILPNDRVRMRTYVRPATHGTNTSGGDAAVPYGVHFRLRADYPIDDLPNDAARTVARALQRFGMYHADGGNVALTAQSDRHTAHTWEETGLEPRDLEGIEPTDFEVIDHGPTFPVTYECERTPLSD